MALTQESQTAELQEKEIPDGKEKTTLKTSILRGQGDNLEISKYDKQPRRSSSSTKRVCTTGN
uniref:Uncharacterized protein n=1 Tax=Oryza rufipogon TaxID=4529 RepID=A0A0E0QW99_ORYRU